MDLDSDYCSNESEGNFQNSSRTPTPSKLPLEIVKLKKSHQTTLNDLDACDDEVTFLIGKMKEKVAFKNIRSLLRKSAVLDKLIDAGTTNNATKNREIEVPNWENAKTFMVFLEYLQTEGFKSVESNIAIFVADLIRLSIDYDATHLLGRFVPLAKQSMTLDNCVELYVLGAVRDIEDLRIAAYQFIVCKGNAFLEHSSFLDLDCITLSILIASDDFQVVELTLFRRLKEWVVNQCKRLGYPPDRKEFFGRVAGLLFHHVRYSYISPKDFREEIIPSGLLSQKDIAAVQLRHQTFPAYWPYLPPSNFVDRPRKHKLQFSVPLYNNVQIGFRKIAGESSTIQESVRFMVSHDIFLTSIGFFGPGKGERGHNGSAPHTAYSIKIHLEGDYTKHHRRLPIQNATVITRENFIVELSHPIHVQKLEPHKLTVWIDGEVTQFGVFPLHQAIVIVNNSVVPAITFHFGDADLDPPTSLKDLGQPSSTAPTLNQNQKQSKLNYKPDPRSSGVIRCISFIVKDRSHSQNL